jgi:phosphoribosylformylglycinamidine synthase
MSKLTTFLFSGIACTHIVFVVESNDELTTEQKRQLEWILNPFLLIHPPTVVPSSSCFIGPNLRFETPESEKLRMICKRSTGLDVLRIERFTAHEGSLKEQPLYDPMTESVYKQIPETLIPFFEPLPTTIVDLSTGGLDLFREMNKKYGMGMDEFDMNYYYSLFVDTYKRNPTDVELMQVAQGNSSHCRHWEFSGKFFIDGKEMNETLFEMVKATLVYSPGKSVKAFKDNGGVLAGNWTQVFLPGPDGAYRNVYMHMNHTATAETHNHPTLISPYPGAATGVGGRLRDIAAIGRGSRIGFGGVYFQTGKLWLEQKKEWPYAKNMATPLEVLIGSIKGASAYGNAFGEPTLLFNNDSLGIKLLNGQRFETIKPIIYTCAVGSIPADAPDKSEAEPNRLIIRIGGATRRIGVGGGAASSMNAGTNAASLDFASVQRGEPMVGRSAYNVIEHCISMGNKNPIESIHDQGAGGASNVITELANPSGGIIDLAKMQIADPSLSQTEAWISESQELYGILLHPDNLEIFKSICEKYDCPIEVLGETNDSKKIIVTDSRNNTKPVDLTLPEILGKLPQKSYVDKTQLLKFQNFKSPKSEICEHLKNVAKVPGVAFLNYMIDHFDGSVGGRVIQGPRSGRYQLPICTYAILSDGFSGVSGSVGALIRSNPVAMLINEEATARMTVAQMLATLSFVPISNGTKHIKARLNVMWPFKQSGMKAKLYIAYKAMTDALKDAGIGIDGGKDSSSLSVTFEGETVMSFPSFILEPYAHVSDYRNRITPELKEEESDLILIELEENKGRMGGSALAEVYNQTGNRVPDASIKKARSLSKLMQYLVRKRYILAGSSKLKGGLLPTLAKMSISSEVETHIENRTGMKDSVFYFNEEIGVVIQCKRSKSKSIIKMVEGYKLSSKIIGDIKPSPGLLTFFENDTKHCLKSQDVRDWFSETGKLIKKHLGVKHNLVNSESYMEQNYNLTFTPDRHDKLPTDKKFKVIVLSAPGTNGHTELAYMFGRMKKQFSVYVVQMKELLSGAYDLKDFNIIAFAGGFSYGDVGGSGKGWAASILFNEKLKKMFDDFYARPDTLSFGVCNGFQVATLLEIPVDTFGQQLFLAHNDSGMFEHRLVNLRIPENTKSIMFRGMEGSIMPAWSAHGEGKLVLANKDEELLEQSGLVAVHYTNSNGRKTTKYPFNPNGSPDGIAGLCTKNGRHTFMMPHIERVSASNHHLPYRPKEWNFKTPIWSKAFDNMYLWLHENVK